MESTSLANRRFRDVSTTRSGDVGDDTLFEYHQSDDGVVWAHYEGGEIRRGSLVGTRSGNHLDFRYVHLTHDGDTASGHCTSNVVILPDGRLRMDESWTWESKPGSGTSVIEEIA